jgi:hypothetical protein
MRQIQRFVVEPQSTQVDRGADVEEGIAVVAEVEAGIREDEAEGDREVVLVVR